MNILSSRNERILTYILAGYCAYYLLISLALAWGFTTDDAYISWFYARQLVNGKGLHWHESMPLVEGYSNFLWIMLAALVLKLQLPLVLTIKWLSVASLAAALFCLYRLSRLFVSSLVAMLPVLIFSHYQGVIWWTVSGLESMFFCALAIFLMWQVAAAFGYKPILAKQPTPLKVSTESWVAVNVSLLLLSLTRFEGIVWALPVAVFVFCQWRKNGLKGFPEGRRSLYLWGLISFCCFVLPYAIYFSWRFTYFGHWIPNSYSCKAFSPGQIGVVDLDYLMVIISLIVASLPYFLAPKDCRHVLLWLPSLLYGLMLWKADPVIAHYLRLFLGPFALFTLLPVLGVYQFLALLKSRDLNVKLMTSLIIIAITFMFIPGTNFAYLHALVADYQERNQSRMAVAQLLNEQAATGATVLLGDSGVIPFYSRPDIRFIDSQCLNNTELTQAPYRHNLERYVDYLHAQLKPDWIIASKYPLDASGDRLIELLEKKYFFAGYQQVAIKTSSATLFDASQSSGKIVDYVYLIYKRRE